MTEHDLRVATFDCYGTLVDWEGGLGTFLASLSLKYGDPNLEPGRALRERWEAIQFEIIQGPYKPYKTVLSESLRAWMEERNLPWDASEGEALVRAMRSWQPFPDTRPALTQAKQTGLRLMILSNTDRDIIADTLRHLEVPFDDVVTAEGCRSYKPAECNFSETLTRIGVPPEQVLHVAFGFKYDIGPAQRLGFRTAWINRHVETAPGQERPDYEWPPQGLARGTQGFSSEKFAKVEHGNFQSRSGIRRSRLFQLLGTEKLPETIQKDIRAGRLSEKQSRALQGLPPAHQQALRDAILADEIPADEAMRLARAHLPRRFHVEDDEQDGGDQCQLEDQREDREQEEAQQEVNALDPALDQALEQRVAGNGRGVDAQFVMCCAEL